MHAKWLRRLLGWLFGRKRAEAPAGTAAGEGGYTRPATWDDVILVARLLAEENAHYVLIGGYALAANGVVRMTEDIDIVVERSERNAKRWVTALARLPEGAAAELIGEKDPFGDADGVIRINDVFTLDVMVKACGETYESLAPSRRPLLVDGVAIRVLNMEGLLKTKRGVREREGRCCNHSAHSCRLLTKTGMSKVLLASYEHSEQRGRHRCPSSTAGGRGR